MIKGCVESVSDQHNYQQWLIYNYCFSRERTQQYQCFAFGDFKQYYYEYE